MRLAYERACRFLEGLADRPVGSRAGFAEMVSRLEVPLPERGEDAERVVEALADAVEPGLMATAGPRFFGFVIGGSLPAALGADWLTSAWDQNSALGMTSPAAAAAEAVAARWILELLGLPASASVGFVTGGQMANFTGLAAARHGVLQRAGWNVEEDGLNGAPPVRILVGEEAHATVFSALRYLGFGVRGARRIPADDQGRMRAEALARALQEGSGPAIVVAQAGNVNTGAFDPLADIIEAARAHGAWVHVDGAFGLWAAASPEQRPLVRGMENADSWATDAHKWLNVPYDSGLAIVADASSHRSGLTKSGAYLLRGGEGEREPHDYVPESSRRARGFAVYAALRSLGRRGLAELVGGGCRQARRMAERLRTDPRVTILNEVVLNQVLFRLAPSAGDPEAFTRKVIAAVQADGTCWLGGTRFRGQDAVRISVSGARTTERDIDRSADAILAAVCAADA